MKLVHSNNGTALLKVSADDVSPATTVLQRDIVQVVGDAYEFSGRPSIQQGAGPQALPLLTFNGGRLVVGDAEHVIHQLSLLQDGITATASNTNIAEIVLADFERLMDEEFLYRFRSASRSERTFFSALIVEFETALEERISSFKIIEEKLIAVLPRAAGFKPKTLSFGSGDPTLALTIDAFANADFTLQRRVGVPYSANRYFSTAPLKTDVHISVLRAIDEAL